MKTKKDLGPLTEGPKVTPGEMDAKKTPILIYILGGIALYYFLTKK
jgi:hypothetical protein